MTLQLVNQTFAELPIGSVKPHPKNPQLGKLHEINRSVKANGWYGGIVVQKSTGFILVGNHRYTVAQAGGAETVPAFVVDVDDQTALRILLADNRVSQLGDFDNAGLASLLQELQGGQGIVGTGYDDADVDKLLSQLGLLNRSTRDMQGANNFAPVDTFTADVPYVGGAPTTDEPADLTPRAEFKIRVRCVNPTAREVLLRRLGREGFLAAKAANKRPPKKAKEPKSAKEKKPRKKKAKK